uniref:Uncharacterized protein n=1 Tax=Oryza nivara TaxID=4536 RepID=A0A0E0J7H6_ORYNI
MLLAAAAAAWRVEALSVKATDTECIDESVPYEGDTVSGTSSSSCTTSTGVPTIPASTSRNVTIYVMRYALTRYKEKKKRRKYLHGNKLTGVILPELGNMSVNVRGVTPRLYF